MKKILIIDDEKDIRFLLSNILVDENYTTIEAGNIQEAEKTIDNENFDLALVDISLGDKKKDGISLLKKIKKINSDIPVIMISGHATIQIAVDSIKEGAFEFLEKPFNTSRLLNFVKRALENSDLKKENKKLNNLFFDTYELIGNSNVIKEIKNTINKISQSDCRVLISGPSGSGKELVARTIHKNSKRRDNPFIVCNGALLDPQHFDIELFGIENKDGSVIQGYFEKTDKGTLLIDNVSEIPLDTQVKILRVLTDQKFRRVNGSKNILTNVRVFTTTSKDLRNEIINGNFREDLFQRISVMQINLPRLRDRIDDLPELFDYFNKKISQNLGKKAIPFKFNLTKMFSHDWDGNIRELRNLVERLIILSDGKQKNIEKIINESIQIKKNNEISNIVNFDSPLKNAREQFEREYLLHQLKKNGSNVSKTAENIGMERSALHRKLTSLGIAIK
jgi:two-component system, NtrC family, nitrogen regulation response regulator NtrX